MWGKPLADSLATMFVATEVKARIHQLTQYGYCIVHMDSEGSRQADTLHDPQSGELTNGPIASGPATPEQNVKDCGRAGENRELFIQKTYGHKPKTGREGPVAGRGCYLLTTRTTKLPGLTARCGRLPGSAGRASSNSAAGRKILPVPASKASVLALG